VLLNKGFPECHYWKNDRELERVRTIMISLSAEIVSGDILGKLLFLRQLNTQTYLPSSRMKTHHF